MYKLIAFFLLLNGILANNTLAQDLNPQLNCTLLGHLSYPQNLSDLWYYVDDLGNEYALVGTQTGTSIVDISTPQNPTEVAFIPGVDCIWREIRTFSHYAYIANNCEGDGLIIADLSQLPNSIETHSWTGNGGSEEITLVHTLKVDTEAQRLYLFGFNYFGGAIIADLSADANNPTIIGRFDERYIHDGFVRNDTLWAAEISDGLLEIIDVSDANNPQILSSFSTPGYFTHSCAVSDDGKYVFTADELNNAYIAAYDINNLSDVKLLDTIQSYRQNEGTAVPHNPFIVPNNFMVCSYYTDGVQIYDTSHPDNLVVVGYYDCSVAADNDVIVGNWGVAPLPSGKLLLSDIQEGLFIVQPNYLRACYLTGTVTNTQTNAPIPNATATLLNPDSHTQTNFSGVFNLGTATAGTYWLVVSAGGYINDTIQVTLANGQEAIQNVDLQPMTTIGIQGTLTDEQSMPIEGVSVQYKTTENIIYTTTTDADGFYHIPNAYASTYQIMAYKWGYLTQIVDSARMITSFQSIDINLLSGYADHFFTDLGWQTSSIGNDNAAWDRGQPLQPQSDLTPATDSPNDPDNWCYLTGNTNAADAYVNGATVTLTSPPMALANYQNATLRFDVWFRNLLPLG